MDDGFKTSKFRRPAYLAENRAVECVNVTIVFAILEVFFISLFFFARSKSKTANAWDTYLMVPAFLFCYSIIPVNICECDSTHQNSGTTRIPPLEKYDSHMDSQYWFYMGELGATWRR